MSKSNTFENELLLHIFNNAAIPLIGDAAGLLPSAAAGSLFVALHTADPGEAGLQNTSEVAYTGYARVAVARTAGAWSVVNNAAKPVNPINFGACTAGTAAATHFTVGTASSGAGKVLYKGSVNPVINIAPGVTPQLTTDTAVTEE
jgi:hypothetical protein